MEKIVFNNEHLLPGNLGHLFVVLSLCAALFGAFAYFLSTQSNEGKNFWRNKARIAFGIHLVSVIGIVASLFYIIYNHYFEYDYAWQHSSISLPVHYMISSFWEGQEGSFLLWMFWHAVIGAVLVFKLKSWESPVMTIVLMAQVVLGTMLLGVEIAGTSIGISPFELLREARPELLTLPVMQIQNIPVADYMKVITDGTGLNPLLQNYWMVIHPPTLFFGFAASIVPFAFAVSGLWLKKFREWIAPALPWTLVAVMILGTGILMGGIWAYESLSFGGYWAWDPVENASLVPWLLIIAGMHVMILNKNSGASLMLAYLLIFVSFILVLYSTFLNRSGILGDTSVHSFTDLDLSGHLLIFMLLFTLVPAIVSFQRSRWRWGFTLATLIVLAINLISGQFLTEINALFLLAAMILLIRNLTKSLPSGDKEESVYTREFWMYVGAIILLLSGIQILFGTSIPVFNKIGQSILGGLAGEGNTFFHRLASGTLAPPEDPITYYNRFQIWFAVFVALLTGFTQFFRYNKSDLVRVIGQVRRSFLLTVIFTVAGTFLFKLNPRYEWQLVVLMFAGFYSIFGNFIYVLEGLKGKIRLAGGSIAHIGFALMLIGILVSSGKKDVISVNTRYAYAEFDEKAQRENILLYKDVPDTMGRYLVTYKGHEFESPIHYYQVDYTDLTNGSKFTLYPNAQINNEQGLMPNPDTRHYITRDIFTHVSSVPNTDEDGEWEEQDEKVLSPGDTFALNRYMVVFQRIDTMPGENISADLAGHLLHIGRFTITSPDSTWEARPVFGMKNIIHTYQITSEVTQAGLRFDFKPGSEQGKFIVQTSVKPKEFIIMKAIVFPYINLLWAGTIIMILGFVLAIRQRNKIARAVKEKV